MANGAIATLGVATVALTAGLGGVSANPKTTTADANTSSNTAGKNS